MGTESEAAFAVVACLGGSPSAEEPLTFMSKNSPASGGGNCERRMADAGASLRTTHGRRGFSRSAVRQSSGRPTLYAVKCSLVTVPFMAMLAAVTP